MLKVMSGVATLMLLVQAGCAPQAEPRVSREVLAQILTQRSHTLKFRGYVGHGDPATAVYVLDEHEIGKGQAGWLALKYVVSQMPKGSSVGIGSYYGGRGFPFREEDLIDYAAQYGVDVGVPAR